MLYIHAWQSLVWNRIVSRRIKEFGLQPIVGDLVLLDKDHSLAETNAEATERNADVTEDNAETAENDSEAADEDGNIFCAQMYRLFYIFVYLRCFKRECTTCENSM